VNKQKPSKYFRFKESSVRRIAKKVLPNCPDHTLVLIVWRVTQKDWRHGTRLPNAVLGMAHAHFRHKHTDYETHLNKHKLTRKEARMLVDDDVAEGVLIWQGISDPEKG